MLLQELNKILSDKIFYTKNSRCKNERPVDDISKKVLSAYDIIVLDANSVASSEYKFESLLSNFSKWFGKEKEPDMTLINIANDKLKKIKHPFKNAIEPETASFFINGDFSDFKNCKFAFIYINGD